MKGASKEDKVAFVRAKRIDFIDLIAEVDVDPGNENKRADKHLDNKVVEWRDVISELGKLASLGRVCITRKKDPSVKQIGARIEGIERYLLTRNIPCKCLPSPARYWNEEKQSVWNGFLLSK